MREEVARYNVFVEGRQYEVSVDERKGTVAVDGQPIDVDLATVGEIEYSVLGDRRSTTIAVEPTEEAGCFRIGDGRRTYEMRVRDERKGARDTTGSRGDQDGDGQIVRASMPGIVAQFLVAHGDAVEVDQPLLILEAMKMENEIRSAVQGHVAEIHVAVGQSVAKGDVLVAIEPVEDDGPQ